MFKNILLPVDLTDKHEAALEAAVDLARLHQGNVTLLHVVETIPGLDFEEERAFFERLRRSAETHLERLGQHLADRNIPWQKRVVFGNRTQETARFAQESQVDLVVLTSPRFDPQQPALSWGSLSLKISLLAPCQVLLVKKKDGEKA